MFGHPQSTRGRSFRANGPQVDSPSRRLEKVTSRLRGSISIIFWRFVRQGQRPVSRQPSAEIAGLGTPQKDDQALNGRHFPINPIGDRKPKRGRDISPRYPVSFLLLLSRRDQQITPDIPRSCVVPEEAARPMIGGTEYIHEERRATRAPWGERRNFPGEAARALDDASTIRGRYYRGALGSPFLTS